MNYIDTVKEELAKHLNVGKGLMNAYSLLVLIKGEETTLRDVHDAWSVNINSVWDRVANGEHRSLVEFDKLPLETQEKDRMYVEAIHETAKILREKGTI